MGASPNVCLKLSNRAENVLLVRETLIGVAEALAIDDSDLNDIKTAVTEACNNVVMHAYAGKEGPLELELYVGSGSSDSGSIEVVVRDRGAGIQPRIPRLRETPAGIGIPVMQALARRVEFSSTEDQGTEVRMEFATPGSQALKPLPEEGVELPAVAQAEELAGAMGIAIAPTHLARAVLPRLLCVLAARAHFSTDRISDTQLVADALVAQMPDSIGESHLGIGVSVEPRTLELHVGPLRRDRAKWRIVGSGIAGLSPVVEKLTNQHGVVAVGSSEALALRLNDQR
ncbi:MAG TPA: ATP-binding protein [Solirubrobacteraceae bacterium]|jgi:anti-sigma regulatory factor (Ser/Thr protein kinase)